MMPTPLFHFTMDHTMSLTLEHEWRRDQAVYVLDALHKARYGSCHTTVLHSQDTTFE